MGMSGHPLVRRAALSLPLAAGAAGLRDARAQQARRSTVVIGRDGWLFPLWDRLDRLDAAALRQVVQVLGEAAGILKQARIDLVFLLLPSKARIYRRFLPDDSRVAPEVDRRYPSVVADLRRAGALVPDLDTAFRAAAGREPHWPLYFKTDTHWTPVGAELAAVTTAADMRAQLRLPPSPRPGTPLGEFRMMRLAIGDLVQYTPQAQRAGFGPEESPIRDVAPASGAAGLLDDDVNDVQIVGTSNVQPRFGFQPLLSNQIVRPVGLSWRPNNIGPYAALLEFLRSADFRRQRPHAIVWNHLENDLVSLPNNPNWQRAAMTPQDFLSQLRRAVS
jgi:alginate O-acetyltransferase complex protein AlgJ